MLHFSRQPIFRIKGLVIISRIGASTLYTDWLADPAKPRKVYFTHRNILICLFFLFLYPNVGGLWIWTKFNRPLLMPDLDETISVKITLIPIYLACLLLHHGCIPSSIIHMHCQFCLHNMMYYYVICGSIEINVKV